LTTAADLLASLEARGVLLKPAPGGALRIRPASELTPAELVKAKALKREILGLLAHRNLSGASDHAPANPWPFELAGHDRRVAAFEPCAACAAGTWVVYGGLPLCLACVSRRGLEIISYRNALERGWALASVGRLASRVAACETVQEVARLTQELGIELADRLYHKQARAYWERSGVCVCCGESGEYHGSAATGESGNRLLSVSNEDATEEDK
jgi:hypothetical protein